MTNYTWYYHDADAGRYHVIERHAAGAARHYRVRFNLDPATDESRTYTGPLPSRSAAERVLRHLAPAAVLLPGLPAWLR